MKCKWGELISLEYGKPVRDKAKIDGKYPVFGTNGQIGTSDLPPRCNHESFILGRKGAYRGVHYSATPFSVIDTAFYAENLCPEKLNMKWAYYKFLTYDINSMDSGSAIPSTDRYEIYGIEVELPQIETQKRIVSLLEAFDKKLALNNQINNNLFEQAKLLFKNWFVDYEPFSTDRTMPETWRMGTVGEIIELHDSKRVPLSSAERAKREKIYPYYGATSQMDYVDDYLFDGIYLLLGEDGTVVDDKGFPILQYIDGKFWVNNHAHILTGKLGYSVEELYLLFSLTNIKSIVTGAVQQKVSQANLKKVPAIIPPKEVLNQFDDIIQPIFAEIRNLRSENQRLSVVRDTLLPKLMSGELDVSDIDL